MEDKQLDLEKTLIQKIEIKWLGHQFTRTVIEPITNKFETVSGFFCLFHP